MKLTIKRIDLSHALSVVKSASACSKLPILANVLLTANQRSVTFTGTDTDLHLRHNCDANVTTQGKVSVRASLLQDIARAAAAETVALSLVSNALHVECGTVKFKLATI